MSYFYGIGRMVSNLINQVFNFFDIELLTISILLVSFNLITYKVANTSKYDLF